MKHKVNLGKLPTLTQAPKSFDDIPESAEYHWSFAIINGYLSEMHWYRYADHSIMIFGHCRVKRTDYRTKREQKMIDHDIKRNIFTYRRKSGYKFAKLLHRTANQNIAFQKKIT